MIRQFGVAVLLISGLYAEVELYACKRAAAQDYRYTYKGAVVQLPAAIAQCIGEDQLKSDWVHDGPCKATDIGFIDTQQRLHFKETVRNPEICAVINDLQDRGYIQQ